MKRFLPLLIVLLTALGASCASPSEHISALTINGTECGIGGQAGAPDDAGVAGSAGSDAGLPPDAGVDSGPPPPVPYAWMVLRQGQSDSLEVATFAGSSLAPWVAPTPLVHYWHILNPSRTMGVTTFGPLGGKFGSELELGKLLDSSATPLFMSTVAISGTQCPAALPAGPGYYSALMSAIDIMIAALPTGPFPVPLNDIIDQGQSDAQAGTAASPRPVSVYLTCLQAVAAEIRAEVARVDGNSLRRVHFVVDKVQLQLPETIGTTTPLAFSTANIRTAEDMFVAADPDAVANETSSLPTSDGFHFNPDGMVTLGGWDAAASVATP